MVITHEPPAFARGIAEPSAHGADDVGDVGIAPRICGIGERCVDFFDVGGTDPTGARKIIGAGDFDREAAPLKSIEFERHAHIGEWLCRGR